MSLVLVEKLGSSVLIRVNHLGRFSQFMMRFFYWASRPPFRMRIIIGQMYFIGNKSLFIISLSGAFAGMVMAYQTYFGFKFISVDSLVGVVTLLSLSKELAPVFTGLIVAGRAGSAMAAQLGTMKVTEQIDALEVMGISSVQYLVVPRVIAATLVLPMLAAIFLWVGAWSSYFVGTQVLLIDKTLYFSNVGKFMFIGDILQCLIKATVFGFTISLIGTFCGLNVTEGAVGVGRGTNQAVVWGMIAVLTLDYFLTSFLIHIL